MISAFVMLLSSASVYVDDGDAFSVLVLGFARLGATEMGMVDLRFVAGILGGV